MLSPFFTQQNVCLLVPVIKDTLFTLLNREDDWAQDGEPVSLDMACKAATKDVI